MLFIRKIAFILLLISLFYMAPSWSLPQDQIKDLPQMQLQRTEYSGYAGGLFYWYVSAHDDSKTAPIVIWTSGGPGSSSLYGFFTENGPYECKPSKNYVTMRKSGAHDWLRFANYLVFDQPLGIGMSFASRNAYPKAPQQGTEQYASALINFMQRHPELRSRPIYLAGESYGALCLLPFAH